MKWQLELAKGRKLEAQRETVVLPPREPKRVMFDEHGTLIGSAPDGPAMVAWIKSRRLS